MSVQIDLKRPSNISLFSYKNQGVALIITVLQIVHVPNLKVIMRESILYLVVYLPLHSSSVTLFVFIGSLPRLSRFEFVAVVTIFIVSFFGNLLLIFHNLSSLLEL